MCPLLVGSGPPLHLALYVQILVLLVRMLEKLHFQIVLVIDPIFLRLVTEKEQGNWEAEGTEEGPE